MKTDPVVSQLVGAAIVAMAFFLTYAIAAAMKRKTDRAARFFRYTAIGGDGSLLVLGVRCCDCGHGTPTVDGVAPERCAGCGVEFPEGEIDGSYVRL